MAWDGSDVFEHYHAKSKILIRPSSPILRELKAELDSSVHPAVIEWAFMNVKRMNAVLKSGDNIFNHAITMVNAWAHGDVKMAVAKSAILSVHAKAKQETDRKTIAFIHAIAQALSVVHTAQHAIGMCCYELTAIIHEAGIEAFLEPVKKQVNNYINTLHDVINRGEWMRQLLAEFILKPKKRPSILNK